MNKMHSEPETTYYFYVLGTEGMTIDGSFTRDMSLWIQFNEVYKRRTESHGYKPLGAEKIGKFVKVNSTLL